MAKRTLKRSDIGYLGIGADGRPITEAYACNPGGFGCTGGCDGCWSRECYGRKVSKCEKCRNFEVHLHPERLCEPANTKTPRLVLLNFTCDTFDEERPAYPDLVCLFESMRAASHHQYILLTQNANRMKYPAAQRPFCENWYWGLTIRNQQDADERLGDFLGIPGKKWVSYEPGQSEVDWSKYLAEPRTAVAQEIRGVFGPHAARPRIQGVIIGHDRRKGAPGTDTVSHIYSCIEQCKAAGVNFWTKQVWQSVCLECGDRFEGCHEFCPFCKRPVRSKLLHASKPDEFALFPKDLKGGRLPWSAPKEQSDG